MKKFLTIALSFALLLSTTACGLNPEAEALKKENEQLKEQLGVTEEKATEKPIEKSADTKSSDKNSDSQYELITGTYVVPDDIPVGKYDVKVISGNGYFLVDGFDSDMSVFDEMDVNADENSNSRVCDYFCKINFSMIKYLVLFGQISKIQLICLFVI